MKLSKYKTYFALLILVFSINILVYFNGNKIDASYLDRLPYVIEAMVAKQFLNILFDLLVRKKKCLFIAVGLKK